MSGGSGSHLNVGKVSDRLPGYKRNCRFGVWSANRRDENEATGQTYASPSSSEPLSLLARLLAFLAGVFFVELSRAGVSFLSPGGAGDGERESSRLISIGSSLSEDSSPPASSRS